MNTARCSLVRRWLLTATAATALLPLANDSARAGDQPVAPAATAAPAAATARRSTFNVSADQSRDPFVPIGYVRPTVAGPAQVKAVTLEVKPEQFVVTSFSLDPPPLAVINGRTYGVGDRLPVDAAGSDFVTVRQIIDGGAILEYHGTLLRCMSRLKGK